jgi:branched-chain amino acid transport system permease protein
MAMRVSTHELSEATTEREAPVPAAEAHRVGETPAPTGGPRPRHRLWRRSDLLLLGLVALAPWLLADDRGLYTTAVTAGCYALVVVSLQWLVGYTGMLALGHPALFGVGAYVSAILTTRHDWPLAPAGVVAIVVVVAIAGLLAPMLRLHGVYLALATLALVFVFGEAIYFWSPHTGGASGLVGIPALPFLERSGPMQYVDYAVVWGLVLLAILASRRLSGTRAGRSLFALREDEDVARSIGVKASRTRIEIWLASAAVSALAGVLYAHHIRYVSPGQFDVTMSLELLAMLIVGGAVSPVGAVLGVLLFVMVPEIFESLGEYRAFLFGTSLLLVVALAPGGLVTVPGRLRAAVAKVRS